MKKILSWILMITCIISLFGCNNHQTQIKQLAMTIKPSEFSQETLDVLKLFDDEIQFYDIQLNEHAKSFSITVWEYENGEWQDRNTSSGQAEFLGNKIAIKLTETNYELYHIDENGHSSIKSPALKVSFDNISSTVKWKVNQEEVLELNKETMVYAKYGFNKSTFSTSTVSTNFRNVECDAGIVITLTIFDKELND